MIRLGRSAKICLPALLVAASVQLAAATDTPGQPPTSGEPGTAAGECASSTASGKDYAAYVMGIEGGALAYQAVNPNSNATATGAYQFIFGTLQDLGYIEPGQSNPGGGPGEWTGVVWTKKANDMGVYSRTDFLNNPAAQDAAFQQFTSENLAAISGKWEGKSVNGTPLTAGGAAAATHMMGAGAFSKWAASGFTAAGLDPGQAAANGMSLEQYQNHLAGRVAGGGCFDPGDTTPAEQPVDDLPEIFLMPWDSQTKPPVVKPGQISSTAR
ncbi:hypothetical protein LAZ40_11475 [Cereibacter sphaeroides]|uniref:hypothetical protein n=1 Tax=Cereibacter sphaeroides TaxID=1063 RepID=UPI001F169B06|nr:hypothetical protein [Cereibacter sphaeroides]MCE6959638.1 hypothetical protein [Cereibacter sphaeroides]MCE6974501.1 hypothetical protein [Cereibacter sphaeroides]